MAVGATDVAQGHLRLYSLDRVPGASQHGNRGGLRFRTAVVELEDEGIVLPAIDAGMRGKVCEEPRSRLGDDPKLALSSLGEVIGAVALIVVPDAGPSTGQAARASWWEGDIIRGAVAGAAAPLRGHGRIMPSSADTIVAT